MSSAIIDIDSKVQNMSFYTCASCAVVLNQQQEQNIAHQYEHQDESIHQTQNISKGKTVVENGKVVVKLAPQPSDENYSNV